MPRTAWYSSSTTTLAGLLIFRLIVLAMVMFGALASLPFVWNLADVSMA